MSIVFVFSLLCFPLLPSRPCWPDDLLPLALSCCIPLLGLPRSPLLLLTLLSAVTFLLRGAGLPCAARLEKFPGINVHKATNVNQL